MNGYVEEGMLKDDMCYSIWGDSYENIVSELWGHAKHSDSDKGKQADINQHDDDSLKGEIEKDFVTGVMGGGNANVIGDGRDEGIGEFIGKDNE